MSTSEAQALINEALMLEERFADLERQYADLAAVHTAALALLEPYDLDGALADFEGVLANLLGAEVAVLLNPQAILWSIGLENGQEPPSLERFESIWETTSIIRPEDDFLIPEPDLEVRAGTLVRDREGTAVGAVVILRWLDHKVEFSDSDVEILELLGSRLWEPVVRLARTGNRTESTNREDASTP